MRTVILLAILLWTWPSAADVVVDPGSVHTGPRILGEPAFVFEMDALTPDEVTRPGWPVTTTRASPCMAYDGTTWHTQPPNTPCVGRFGLEVFGSLTNQWTFSNDATQWNPEATPIVTPQPDGSFLVEDDNAGAFEGLRSPSVAATAGETWTVTCEVKRGTASTFRLAVEAANPCTLISVPTEWTRVSCTRTLTGSTARGAFYPADNGSGDTGGTYVRQCQLEKSPTPGPRHDCAGSPCTRAADLHDAPAAVGALPTSSGRVKLRATVGSPGTVRVLFDTRAVSGVNGMAFFVNQTNGLAVVVTGASIDTAQTYTINASNAVSPGVEHALDLSWDGVSYSAYVDGALVGTVAGSAPPAHSQLRIGANRSGSNQIHGSIRLLRVGE